MRRLLPISLLLVAAAAPTRAAEVNHAAEYAACMAQVERDAVAAFDAALAWHDLGGGDAADHCAAKALMWLKQYAEAARRFEALAQHTKADAAMRAALFDQAAQAWLLADDAARADDVLTAAIGLSAADPERYIDRARARAAMKRWWEVVDDLNRVIEIAPTRADAFVYRATAYRYLDSADLALADVERALELDPGNPQALFERGVLRRLGGDAVGARKDWIDAIAIAPGTETARMAQTNIEILELGAESPK